MNIAIDGPAGAGKSTVAKKIAERLHILYLDTGAMYRAVALKALNEGVDADDESAVAAMLKDTEVAVVYEGGAQKVLLCGNDVTGKIRDHRVSGMASRISRHACVRQKLLDLQREIAARGDVVLDGRDIGSFVLPNAEYKFFLTASVKVRALRRFNELSAKGEKCSLQEIEADIEARDYSDSHREVSPLVQAKDAVVIDTSLLTIDEVTEELLRIIGAGEDRA